MQHALAQAGVSRSLQSRDNFPGHTLENLPTPLDDSEELCDAWDDDENDSSDLDAWFSDSSIDRGSDRQRNKNLEKDLAERDWIIEELARRKALQQNVPSNLPVRRSAEPLLPKQSPPSSFRRADDHEGSYDILAIRNLNEYPEKELSFLHSRDMKARSPLRSQSIDSDALVISPRVTTSNTHLSKRNKVKDWLKKHIAEPIKKAANTVIDKAIKPAAKGVKDNGKKIDQEVGIGLATAALSVIPGGQAGAVALQVGTKVAAVAKTAVNVAKTAKAAVNTAKAADKVQANTNQQKDKPKRSVPAVDYRLLEQRFEDALDSVEAIVRRGADGEVVGLEALKL